MDKKEQKKKGKKKNQPKTHSDLVSSSVVNKPLH